MAPQISSIAAFSAAVNSSVFMFSNARFIIPLMREKGRTQSHFLNFRWLSIIFFRSRYPSSLMVPESEQVLESTSPSTASG